MPSLQAERGELTEETRAYEEESEKFRVLGNNVSRTLTRLVAERERATGILGSIKEGRTAFTEALEALKNDVNAIKEANAAQDALTKAEKSHSDHPDRKSNAALEEATRRVQKASEVQDKTLRELRAATKYVEKACSEVIADIICGFKVKHPVTLESAESEDNNLMNFYETTYSMLKSRSVEDLQKFVSFWDQAFDAQREICSVHEGETLPRLTKSYRELREVVFTENKAPQRSIDKVRQAREEMVRIEKKVETLMKTKNLKLKDAKKRLEKAFIRQERLKGSIASAEQKEGGGGLRRTKVGCSVQ